MENYNYAYIPLLIVVFLQIFFPYLHNMRCLDTWITPHFYFCVAIFYGVYVLFGILLWKSRELQNNEIFALVWVLVFLNICWIYLYRTSKKLSLILLFLSLLFGYFVYNAIFLSDLTLDDNTLYLNSFSVYLVWIGLMITILIESSQIFPPQKSRTKTKKLI